MANQAEKDLPNITLLEGTMLNFSGHEDDDCLVVLRPTVAQVVGPEQKEGLPLIVPGGPPQIVFLHQPEKSAHLSKRTMIFDKMVRK